MPLYCLDANALITPWKNSYPPDVFPTLWDEIAKQWVNLEIIKPIYDEIRQDTSSDGLLLFNRLKKNWIPNNKC